MMKIDLTGTHEENMTAINNAEISEEFKAHIRKDLQEQVDRCLSSCFGVDLDIEHEKNSIPIHELVPKGMTIKSISEMIKEITIDEETIEIDLEGAPLWKVWLLHIVLLVRFGKLLREQK